MGKKKLAIIVISEMTFDRLCFEIDHLSKFH